MNKTLHQYQFKNIKLIKERKKIGLFLDMGLGKTITTLTSINELLIEKKIKKVLVIAPLRVCNMVWQQELNNWTHLDNIKISVVTGTVKQREKALNDMYANVFVINRENTCWLFENHKSSLDFDMLVIDEASSFKNHKSKRFKTLKHKLFNYVVLLTGSPCANSIMDIWSLFFLLDKGDALGRYFTHFRNRYFNQDDFNKYKYTLKPNALNNIAKKIKHLAISMKSKDYLTLPPYINNNVYLELSPSLQRRYNMLDSKMVLTNIDEKNILLLIQNQLTLSNKLLQFCNGFVYNDEGNAEYIHDLKIKALLDILEDNPNNSYIVAYNFKEDLKVLLNALPEAKVLSTSGVEAEEWLKGKFKVLLLHPRSAGHGLNLQTGGNNIIWYSIDWSLETYTQLNARLYRQGQQKPVIVTHLIIKNCLDDKVVNNVLTIKSENQDKFNNLIKQQGV